MQYKLLILLMAYGTLDGVGRKEEAFAARGFFAYFENKSGAYQMGLE